MRLRSTATAMALALFAMQGPAWADMEAAKAFLDAEIGDLSVLSRADQEKEMQWFIDAAKPFQGMEIKVVSETIATHEYESKVLAPAFTAITGIPLATAWPRWTVNHASCCRAFSASVSELSQPMAVG